MNDKSDLVKVIDGEPRADSYTLSERVHNQHRSVMQLIRQNQTDFEEFGRVSFEMRPFETAGGTQNREVALLNEDQATLLMTYLRNNDVVRKFKIELVKAFARFRNAMTPNLNDPVQLRTLLSDYAGQVIELQADLDEAKPKVEALKRLEESDGSMNLTAAAKVLKMQPKRLTKWMQANGWLYRRVGGPLLGYQTKIQAGYLEHKTWTNPETDKTYPRCVVLPKGLAKMAKLLNVEPELFDA